MSFVDVVSKLCVDADCTRQPSFGKPGGSAVYCKVHSVAPFLCNVRLKANQR